jgi:signal transduction histidine kinase
LTVRFKIALTIFVTGALTALGVIATVLFAFERFEHESAYHRADAFLGRVMANHDNLFEMQDRFPEEFGAFLRNLVLFEPDTQLYLLDAQGTVLVSTGEVKLPAGFKVALAPVLQAAGKAAMPYVLGDDPERMDDDAVIAARAVRRAVIRSDEPVAGYLYVVCHKQVLTAGRGQAFRSAFARPAFAFIIGVVVLTTLLALWIIASVTRPLRQLTEAVASLSARGLEEGLAETPQALRAAPTRDEFGQLGNAFEMMWATLRKQWAALRRLDHFRREGVSNLSHDLRSPLTATVACLETLDTRWAGDPARADDRALVEMALRNTRNAARMVQSLGDLAQLDEPEFKLRAEVVDAGELLDDIALRFAPRAALQGVRLAVSHADDPGAAPPFASLDIELFERAIANLVDNALKFCPRGSSIALAAVCADGQVRVSVADTGPGIPAADLPHLFDRFYQSRQSVAPATGEGGKGLGLAIVKRIAELHGGTLAVESRVGAGTCVTLSVPARV